MSDAAPTPVRVDRRHWTLAVAAGMASFLDSGAIISVGLGLALWRDAFGLDLWMVGFLGAALTLFIGLGALFGGRLADLFGRSRLFSITILIYAAGAALVALAPNSGLLVAGVVIIGIAAGADLPTSIAVLAERAPDGARGRLVAFTHVMWTAGVVTATLLGFAFSGLGRAGISLIFGILAALAIATWAFRTFYPPFRELDAEAHARSAAQGIDAEQALPLRALLSDKRWIGMIVATAAFYLFFTLVANTFGSFKNYFMITVGGADQSAATAISFGTTLVGLVGTIVFTRIADTRWRNRFYFIGVALFVTCQLLIAFTSGAILPVIVVALVLYNLAFPYIGEALYKVWTQEYFPVNARATVQGATMAVARFAAAAFALVTPALLAWSPAGLFFLLAGFALCSAAVGTFIMKRLRCESVVGPREHAGSVSA